MSLIATMRLIRNHLYIDGLMTCRAGNSGGAYVISVFLIGSVGVFGILLLRIWPAAVRQTSIIAWHIRYLSNIYEYDVCRHYGASSNMMWNDVREMPCSDHDLLPIQGIEPYSGRTRCSRWPGISCCA